MMPLINLPLLLLTASIFCCCCCDSAISGDAVTQTGSAQSAPIGAHDELVRLVSRLRFELRRMESKSKRCATLADQIDASEPIKSLLNARIKGESTQVKRLIAASSQLQQHTSPLITLVAFVEECANELGARPEDFEWIDGQVRASIGQDKVFVPVLNAGAQDEKVGAEEARTSELEAKGKLEDELAEQKAQLQSQLAELQSTVKRLSEANEAKTKLEGELNEKQAQLKSELVQLEASVKRLSEVNEANERELAKLRASSAAQSGELDQCRADKQQALSGVKSCQAALEHELTIAQKGFETELERLKSVNLKECKSQLDASAVEKDKNEKQIDALAVALAELKRKSFEELEACQQSQETTELWIRRTRDFRELVDRKNVAIERLKSFLKERGVIVENTKSELESRLLDEMSKLDSGEHSVSVGSEKKKKKDEQQVDSHELTVRIDRELKELLRKKNWNISRLVDALKTGGLWVDIGKIHSEDRLMEALSYLESSQLEEREDAEEQLNLLADELGRCQKSAKMTEEWLSRAKELKELLKHKDGFITSLSRTLRRSGGIVEMPSADSEARFLKAMSRCLF